MIPFRSDYVFMPIRDAAILTTGYVAGNVIGAVNAGEKPASGQMLQHFVGTAGLFNQIILYVDFTKGSLTTAEILVEFSDNNVDWYAETVDDVNAGTGIITERNAVRQLTANGKYRIPIRVNDNYIRVSIKGTGTVTSSSAKIGAIIGNN